VSESKEECGWPDVLLCSWLSEKTYRGPSWGGCSQLICIHHKVPIYPFFLPAACTMRSVGVYSGWKAVMEGVGFSIL
jgi:hypothetical protein